LPMYRELADIRAIVERALDTVAPLLRQRGLSCRAEWPETLDRVFVDQTRIRQVMINLLNNAANYTDRGGITVRIQQTREALTVSVEDTGVGIPADKLEAIFEEFQQVDDGLRRRGGAGLGLALSRQFVELHGGRMWAESEVGVGSRFHFSLPLPGAVPQTTPLVQTGWAAQADLSRRPVVVVDPDPTVSAMLGRYLGDRPLLPARDTAEAEALIEAEHPSAVIVNQPANAPAEAWVAALGGSSQHYNVPVFRCSIPSGSWLKESTGLDDCLTKPVTRESLQAALAEHCREPGTVLVIDDSPGFTSLMARMLMATGLARQVLAAYTGSEGLRLARETVPPLILLDLLLPDMDGFSVLSALRQEPALASTRVVAVTATSYAEEVLRRQGAHFVLTQAGGISAAAFTELLSAALSIVQPNYAGAQTDSVAT
ncbi:MAG: ATP-binding protein, partial [Anaerolineae bacterium]|nr:ATP-binding protein [Anaerolineae bacterium]